MNDKNINENIIFDLVGGAGLKAIEYIKQQNAKHGTEYKLKIADIIQYTLKNKTLDLKNCEHYKNLEYLICVKELNKLKIVELEKSKRYCKLSSNFKLCELRILEKINEIKIRNIKQQMKIQRYKTEQIRSQNLRHLKRDEYYGNEYLSKDE